jgi:parallel beta-helix repeat protein
MVLSFVTFIDTTEDIGLTVSGSEPIEITRIDVEAAPDFLVVGHASNILIWLYDSLDNGIEGISDTINLSDENPGSNPDGWFSEVYEKSGGLYNATYNAPPNSDPNVIINVTNDQNEIFTTQKIIIVDTAGNVEIIDGHLHIDDILFYIQGLSYAPTYNGSDKYDDNAVLYDMQKIADAHVNTLRLYVANKYFWGGELWDDAQRSADIVLDYADIYNIKIIVGFWADERLDWTDSDIRDNQTTAWMNMVLRYKDAEPVLLWAVGNEVLNNMDSENKTAYAQWMENMMQWTHINDPSHPLTYSDAGLGEINTLKTNVPSLDIFSFNHYDFENANQFQNVLDTINSNWPIPVLLNEYGSDSRDDGAGIENMTKHATRLYELYEAVENDNRDYPPGFLGSLWFEWTDQWNFEGNPDKQDPGTWWGWSPLSCFDNYADLEYFGIAYCANYDSAATRELKDAYWVLKELYTMPVRNIDLNRYYWTIQSAIDDANLGNTIEVGQGIYEENVIIDKRLIIIGNDLDNTIIDGGGGLDVVKITGDDVHLQGFTILNGTVGINLNSTLNSYVEGNIVTSTSIGIKLTYSSSNTIYGNNISACSGFGIHLDDTTGDNLIIHNNFMFNGIQAYDEGTNNLWNGSYPSGGNYWSDYGGLDNYQGPNQNITGSDSIGDAQYDLDLDSHDYYPFMEPHSFSENQMVLKQGWNLVSIPNIQEDKNIQMVLASIHGLYDAVQWYDPTDSNDQWKHYKEGKPHGNDLSQINERMGFWIHIIQPGTTIFIYNGTPPMQNQTITLHQGWNLVGYPSLSNKMRTEALNNITFGSEVDSILTYDPTVKKWEEMDPSDYFEIGKGYYIHAKTDCDWEVPL